MSVGHVTTNDFHNVCSRTARSGRLASLKATICKEYADLTLIHVEDIAKGDFTESLKGHLNSCLWRQLPGSNQGPCRC